MLFCDHHRYGNNCRCADHCWSTQCFAGDVNATLSYGFDSIKLDGYNDFYFHKNKSPSPSASNTVATVP